MKRKVIQLARKTLVVSLPSKWARNNGVKKGFEINVEERGKQIVFSTESDYDVEKIEVDISDLNSEVTRRWLLASLHKSGYDEIIITYKDPSLLKTIQDAVAEMFIGFAIVEQTKTKCIIKMIAKEQEKEFDTLLRRAFLVTKSLGESMVDYIKEGRLKELEELISLEKTNNQLTNFCERILNKKGFKDYKKTCFIYVIAWNLEKICDDYKAVCKFLSRNPKTKANRIVGFLKKCNEFFNAYYELYYKFELRRLTELNETRKNLESEFFKLLKNADYKEAFVLCLLRDFVIKISDMSASYIAANAESG